MSAWGDVGTTWGDGPPERIIRVPRQVTAAAAPDTADPGPLEQALADLREILEEWRRGELHSLNVAHATVVYLAALDGDVGEVDP